MEIRNTPPPAAVADRSDARLLEDFCLALRDVGNLDCGERMAMLSQQAGWQADRLLADCLGYPDTLPLGVSG
ncbi:MAG: hypothetical protein IT162_02405 [Bryobacterales bacterium]|nr:hypothetical protein [Bryobacterales bacterium]